MTPTYRGLNLASVPGQTQIIMSKLLLLLVHWTGNKTGDKILPGDNRYLPYDPLQVERQEQCKNLWRFYLQNIFPTWSPW